MLRKAKGGGVVTVTRVRRAYACFSKRGKNVYYEERNKERESGIMIVVESDKRWVS